MESLKLATGSLFCAEDVDDVASWDDADWESSSSLEPMIVSSSSSSSSYIEPHRPVEDLFSAEVHHMPHPDYLLRFQDGSLDCNGRQRAVSWILKVHEFYRFLPVTASLAVNYLDRFLSTQVLPRGLGWPWQLLSVACLSVAAKIEETHVPVLPDLQILDPGCVFEPRTVRRMELLLMSALRWRTRSVTPYDFASYFCSLLRAGEDSPALLRRVSSLILASHQVVDFSGFRPSVIAAAAILCATASSVSVDEKALFDAAVPEERVDECCQLFSLYGFAAPFKLPAPRSPAGVLDAMTYGSCDSQKSATDAAEPHPELSPPSKRRKMTIDQDLGR